MAKLIINNETKKSTIAPEIYGHFSEHLGRCIYEGLYVGENSDIPNVNGMRTDIVEALKEMKIPVLRWPGGCFADEYHWMDGIGPKENRKKMINTHWGGVVEDNSFGTHEFFELCRQLGCKTYVNGNLGSGTVREMSEWVEYITFNGVSPMLENSCVNGQEQLAKVSGQPIQSICRITIKGLLSGTVLTLSKRPNSLARIQRPLSARFFNPDSTKSRPIVCAWGF